MKRILLFAFGVGALWLFGCMPAQGDAPRYQVGTFKPEDRVTFEWRDEIVYFDISSPSGIGGAQIAQTAGASPQKILLRVRLKGLELFQFSYGKNHVQVNVSSGGDNAVVESVRLDNAAEFMPIDSNSEFWLPLEIISQNKTIPLQDGYFQVELPRAFYASRAREFSIEWIDFYR